MKKEVNIQIGERIRSYLEGQGLQQQDVAERLGISQSAVSAYYRGKPIGKNAALKWEEAFGFRATWLILGEGEMLIGATKSDNPGEPKPASDSSLVDYLQRKIAELEGKIEKLNDERADLLQENAVLRYENMMLNPRKGDAEDAEGFLSADAL